MAAKTATTKAKTDVAGRRVAKKGEPALAAYAEKNIPAVIEDFAEFLKSETGYDVDIRSVYLGSSLRAKFQKSDANQERIARRAEELIQEREARAQAKIERAAAKEARAAERAEKAAAREAAKSEKTSQTKVQKAAATKVPAKTAAKKPATKAAPATTRRRPARAAAKDEDI